MIGYGLKKLARESGMELARGVAFGSLRGYGATLSEGSGYKQVVFSVQFADPAKRQELLDALSGMNLEKQYRVANLYVSPRAIQIMFQDTVGTMKKIRQFLDVIIPMLQCYGASTADTCAECGGMVTGGRWIMVDKVAYHLHEGCAEKVKQQIDEGNEQQRQEAQGSYIRGAVGALLGAILGAVAWAVVLQMGYVAALVGLLIGWLANRGYDLLRGKQGKGKVPILILAVALSVLLGNFGSDAISLLLMINGGELPGFVFADIPGLIILMLKDNSEYLSGTISNILLGFLFAGLGVFGMLRKTSQEVSGTKYAELK